MPIVTATHPTWGSVEYYTDMIRRHAQTTGETHVVMISLIDMAAACGEDTNLMLGRVRNALAAGELVLEEMRQADR